MTKQIRDTLARIGLTKGEIDVYMALLEFGTSTTGSITKQAGISSSKVYEVLQRLIAKGLASYVVERGVHQYSATPPERLIDFLEERKEDISKGQEEISKLIPALNLSRKHEETGAVIYRGPEGPKIALRMLLEEGRKGHDSYGFGTNEDDYVKHFPAQLQDHIERSKRMKFRTRLLFGEGFRSPNLTADIRFLPREYIMPVRTMIAGDKVFIVDFTAPMTTIVIQKKEIADAYRGYFAMLWKIGKPAKRSKGKHS